jgi:hypothetical protein
VTDIPEVHVAPPAWTGWIGFVERVSSGLYVLSFGVEWGRLFLDTAPLLMD